MRRSLIPPRTTRPAKKAKCLDQIGKYKVLEKIGQGATSTVYRGYDAALGRYVAIKTISADAGGDETLRRRFEREAQSAARLAHPHIITVYDFGQEQDKLYMAMELLEGEDLKQAIVQKRIKTLDQKLDIMEQISDGLAFAHANEIIHRDLKPANIRLLADGQIKIMDFGLARQAGSDMTRTGLVMGTPYYMSPEQMRGEQVDTRSDVFSLGCVFYELITDTKPFDAESLHSVLYKVLQAEPRPARELVPDLPEPVLELLDRALAKDRTQRFADGGELLEAVQNVRHAVAAGREDQSGIGLPTVLVPPPTPGVRSDSRVSPPSSLNARSVTAVRRPDRTPAPASRMTPRPAPPPARSNTPLYVGAVAALVLAAILGLLAFRLRRAPAATPSPAPSSAGQLDALARMVVATEVENARNKLKAGDYEEALRRAERALKLDPTDAAAKKVEEEARPFKEKIDRAAEEARAAAASGDAAKTADALWHLLQVAPDHALAVDLVPGLDASYRPRAEEAQRLMTAARQSAEKAQAARLPLFEEGTGLAGTADLAFRARRFAAAARDLMRARARFERAERSTR